MEPGNIKSLTNLIKNNKHNCKNILNVEAVEPLNIVNKTLTLMTSQASRVLQDQDLQVVQTSTTTAKRILLVKTSPTEIRT